MLWEAIFLNQILILSNGINKVRILFYSIIANKTTGYKLNES